MFEETNIYDDSNDVETEAEPDDIIIVHMDIREPLSTLKSVSTSFDSFSTYFTIVRLFLK